MCTGDLRLAFIGISRNFDLDNLVDNKNNKNRGKGVYVFNK